MKKCFESIAANSVKFPTDLKTSTRKFSQTSMASSNHVLTLDCINPNVKTMEYAVRGPIVIRAVEIEKELLNEPKHPFKNVIKANIGDAQAMGQKPITFIRQVLACVTLPSLLESSEFPSDVKKHAKDILSGCGGGSVGSYSQSNGIEIIRKHVAEYIERRDGIPANPEHIVLSGGASEAIRNVLQLFVNNTAKTKVGIMIPIPQYPLYSATIEEFNLGSVSYYLDESKNWGLDLSELERSYEENQKNYDIKAIVIINPGNPTGQVLARDNIEGIIKFAQKKNLFIFADEAVIDCVVNPPKENEPSYGQWLKEKTDVLASLKERAQLVTKAYNAIDGVSMNEVQGAMYAFPKVELSQKSKNMEPDFFYVKELLEETGVCVVPGSGFGQKPGTYHFRTTILPQPETFKDMLKRFTDFHQKFMQKYA